MYDVDLIQDRVSPLSYLYKLLTRDTRDYIHDLYLVTYFVKNGSTLNERSPIKFYSSYKFNSMYHSYVFITFTNVNHKEKSPGLV